MKTNISDFFVKADDKLELRLPKQVKKDLKREAREKGFSTLSKYVLAMILQRGGK